MILPQKGDLIGTASCSIFSLDIEEMIRHAGVVGYSGANYLSPRHHDGRLIGMDLLHASQSSGKWDHHRLEVPDSSEFHSRKVVVDMDESLGLVLAMSYAIPDDVGKLWILSYL
jgi:hypothetical protein